MRYTPSTGAWSVWLPTRAVTAYSISGTGTAGASSQACQVFRPSRLKGRSVHVAEAAARVRKVTAETAAETGTSARMRTLSPARSMVGRTGTMRRGGVSASGARAAATAWSTSGGIESMNSAIESGRRSRAMRENLFCSEARVPRSLRVATAPWKRRMA